MAGGMDKYWIIPRVVDKELPRVGHKLASCSLLISYVLMVFYCTHTHRHASHRRKKTARVGEDKRGLERDKKSGRGEKTGGDEEIQWRGEG